MSYNFKNLAEVELLAEVPEGCTAFAEVDGVVKRVPSKGLGGEGGIKTAIIKDSEYDNALSGLTSYGSAGPTYTYECTNMTFEDAYEAMSNGEPLACIFMSSQGFYESAGPSPAYNVPGVAIFSGTAFGVPCIGLFSELLGIELYWTADGVSTNYPDDGGK